MPDVDRADALSRLTMLACQDASPASLTEKILARPGLIADIRALIGDPSSAHLTCFTATALERTLAVRLGIPLYGCDPGASPSGHEEREPRGVPIARAYRCRPDSRISVATRT